MAANNLGDYQPSPAEARLQSALKWAIGIMTLIMIVGLGAIAYRILGSPEDTVSSGEKVTAAQLALPTGSDIRLMAFSGNRLAVHYAGPAERGIAFVDVASGRTLARIVVTETGDRAEPAPSIRP